MDLRNRSTGFARGIDRLLGKNYGLWKLEIASQSPVPNKENTKDGKDESNDCDDDESGGPARDEVRRFMGGGGCWQQHAARC